MRLLNKYNAANRRRRGLSFVEVIISLVVVALVTMTVIAFSSIIKTNTMYMRSYTVLNAYAIDKLDRIQNDLEHGVEIEAENYNDNGEPSASVNTEPIQCNTIITNIGPAFGEPFYKVELFLFHQEHGTVVHTIAFIRKGCITYAP